MSTPTKFFLFVALLWCCSFTGHAQQIYVSSSEPQAIGQQVEYFLDPSHQITVHNFLSAPQRYNFTKSNEKTLNFGPTSSVCWIRFNYVLSDTVEHLLALGNTNLNEVDTYVFDGDSVVYTERSGLSNVRSKVSTDLTLNALLFSLPKSKTNEALTCYLMIRDNRRVIVPMEITTLNAVIRASHKEDFLVGLYFGCMAIIAILNIYFFVTFKESVYFFYGGHIVCQILINAILKGYLFTLIGTGFYFINPYVPAIAGISNVFVILFALTFLDISKLLPTWHRPTLALITLPFINILLNAFGFFQLSAQLGTYIGILVCIWLFVLGLAAYSRKATQARFYIIGWGAFFIGILILNSALNQWLSINTFTYNAALYGTVFEVLLISFGLADRVNIIRLGREEEKAQRLLLIEKQNSWLEENVKLRTIELTEKNKEIEVQNEELRQQHEELTSTHELLEKQTQLIAEKNKDIGLINQTLEENVKQRTMELEETVGNLVRQNNDLEQFSYIVSHNMRAPVARILGLIHLLELDNEHDEQQQLIEFLKESTMGLDEIIHDLSQIIGLRRGSEMILENVDLEKVIFHNLSDLTDEAKKSKAQVEVNIGARELRSVKSYIQSIVYNLVSNAIKYRDPERDLKIKISTAELEGNVILEVEDSGLGINTPPDKIHEIFNLYKRTYTHVQGKGLGLYILKTQVEALHGTVEVQSKLGKGSLFRVLLPKPN